MKSKAGVIFIVMDALSGLLSAISLIGTLIVDTKEAKQIGCDSNANTKK